MSAAPLLKALDLSIGYGGQPLLGGISFDIEPRDFFGLVGPNGAGKSTLLMTLLGNIPPVRGSVVVRSSVRFGYVPQRTRLDSLFPMSAIEVVRSGGMGPKASNKKGWLLTAASKADAIASLDLVGMASLATTSMRDLSGGQQRRVLIARALVREPDLLILDEPTAGMDIPTEHDLLGFISHLNAQRGTAVVLVAHQVSLVAGRANRMVLINKDTHSFAVGAAEHLLTSQQLTALYGEPMQVLHIDGQVIVRREPVAPVDRSEVNEQGAGA